VPEGRFVIEQAPAWRDSSERGVVAEGAVGSRAAGRFRLFRYEIRCWARWRHPRSRRGGCESEAPQRRSRSRHAGPRARPGGADPGLGPGRTPRRGDVELELHDLLARHAQRTRCRSDPAPTTRASAGLARRHRSRAAPRGARPPPRVDATRGHTNKRHVGIGLIPQISHGAVASRRCLGDVETRSGIHPALHRMSYAAVGGPNQVVSVSARPSWVRSPTQAT
jgi:hypothetical protein